LILKVNISSKISDDIILNTSFEQMVDTEEEATEFGRDAWRMQISFTNGYVQESGE
jgi:hypothetical protein